MDILKIERNKLEDDILEIENLSKNDREHISLMEKEIHDLELKNSKYEIRIDDGLKVLNEDYSITYNEAKNKYKLEGKVDDFLYGNVRGDVRDRIS